MGRTAMPTSGQIIAYITKHNCSADEAIDALKNGEIIRDPSTVLEKALSSDPATAEEGYIEYLKIEKENAVIEKRMAEESLRQVINEFNGKLQRQVAKGLNQNQAEALTWQQNPSLLGEYQRLYRIVMGG